MPSESTKGVSLSSCVLTVTPDSRMQGQSKVKQKSIVLRSRSLVMRLHSPLVSEQRDNPLEVVQHVILLESTFTSSLG